MFNFFKKEPIIEFLTEDFSIRKYMPVIPASELKPQEFTNLSPTVPNFHTGIDRGTARLCPAIKDFLDTGYIIRAWCDMKFEFQEIQGTKVCHVLLSKTGDGVQNHDKFQLGQLNDKKYIRHVVKLMSPWWIKTAPGYSFYFMPLAFWQLPYQPVAGVVNGDMTHMHCPINLWVEGNETFEIKFGDPLVQVVPFKRENNVTAVVREVTDNDRKRESKLATFFGTRWVGSSKYFTTKNSYKVKVEDTEL
jgi:hypothetical protein